MPPRLYMTELARCRSLAAIRVPGADHGGDAGDGASGFCSSFAQAEGNVEIGGKTTSPASSLAMSSSMRKRWALKAPPTLSGSSEGRGGRVRRLLLLMVCGERLPRF